MFSFVFVLYKPNIESLSNCVKSLTAQGVSLVFVQNCNTELPGEIVDNGTIIRNNSNLGIASAQNIGVNYSFNQGADFVVLCDQDTCFPLNFVESCILKLALKLSGIVGISTMI